jgi:hypothetical protein
VLIEEEDQGMQAQLKTTKPSGNCSLELLCNGLCIFSQKTTFLPFKLIVVDELKQSDYAA